MADDLRMAVEAPASEYTLLQVQGVQYMADDTNRGSGILTLTSTRVNWSDPNTGASYDWDYRTIIIHAISREPFPHIYLQISGEDETSDPFHVRFIPQSESDLQPLFDAFSKGAELNPDPVTDDFMEDDMDSAF